MTFAQHYPITVTTILTPPYTTSLATMAESGSTRLMVNLLVNDVTITEIPVKLHIEMESAGITIESIPTQAVAPMFLGGGEARVLTGDDFAQYLNINNLNFKGFSKAAYQKSGHLPAGLWKFSVSVRHFYTNKVISNVGTATAWITSYKPPVLTYPKEGENAPSNAALPLSFSWQASKFTGGTTAVMYRFEMWERRIEGVPAQAVAASVPPIYTTETAGRFVEVMPAMLALEPGMKYCWRVTAYDPSGMVSFENKGESEVRMFQYLEKCPEVCGLAVDIKDDTGYASWEENRIHVGGYNFEFYDDEGTCHKTLWGSTNKTAGIGGEYGKTWHVRVQGICRHNVEGPWSDWVDFKIPDAFKPLKDENGNTFECGKETPERVITNFTLRDNLQKGDTIETEPGTTKFVIHSATRNEDGSFRGLSYVLMRIWGASFLGEFDHLKVNTDGVIIGKYAWRTVNMGPGVVTPEDIERWADEMALVIAGATYNSTIKDTISLCCGIKFESIRREGNRYYALRNDTLPVEITRIINGKTRVMVKDDNGHELVIDKDGNVMGVEEYKKCGGSKALLRENIKEKDSQVTKSGNVKFYSAGDYLFDTYDTYVNSAAGYAERFPSIGEGDYRPAYACAESNTQIEIKAEPYENITFKTERGVPVLCKDGILEVTTRGDRDTTSIYAYDADNHIVGKVNVLSYDKVTRKICLVPIGDTKAPDATKIKQGLDEIFAKLMVDFDVTIAEPIAIQYAKGSVFTHGGSGVIGVYNADQKAAISKLKGRGIDNETVYLFFVKECKALKANDSPDVVNGYMPRGYQFGFIYKELNNFRTIAHEMCHGAFHLKHTFDATDYLAPEGQTDNLMDYVMSQPKTLNHWQWKDIHQPKSVRFKWLQEEEEAEALGHNTHAKCINGKAAEALLKCRYFYLPDKRVIDIQSVKGYLPSGFYTEKDGTETDNARGALYAVRSGDYDKVVYYGKDTRLVTSFGHNIGEQVSKVPIDKFKVYDAIPSDVTPVTVYVRDNEILVYSKGELVETIQNTGGCDCITNEIATPSFFVASSNVTKAYIEYATSHSMPVGESIFTDGELADILCKRIKEGKTSELGELIEDKLLAYKDMNGRNFIVVDVQTDVVCESQQAWNKLAKTVFHKAGLTEKDILITVPYAVCEGIGRDLGKVYFMPGLAYGEGVKIDLEKIGKQHVNTAATSQFASGTALQPIAKFVMDVFTQTYKRVEIYRGIYTATNAIYCERYTNNNENVVGYNFNRRIVLYKQKGIDEILSIMKEADRAKQLIAYQLATYGEDGPCYSCPSYEELTQEKAFVEDYYKYAIVEKVKQIGDDKNDLELYVPQTYTVELKEQFMSSPSLKYKELANNAEAYIYSDAFKDLIEALGYEHPNGFESFSFAPEHAFTSVWDYKLRPVDEVVYNTIDGVGVVLGAFGLDIFSDVAGMAYSSFRGDGTNVAAYSASVLFIGPEGLVVKKGISSSKNLILRTAKGEIIEVDDLVKSTKYLDGIVSSDISIEELRSLQKALNSCHLKLSEDMESMFALHSILTNNEAKKWDMKIDFFTGISGTKDFSYKEMLQTLNSFAKAVESNKLYIDIDSFKRVLAEIKKSGPFEIGAEWTLRYISQHGGEFAGKELKFEVVEDAVEKIRRVDLEVFDEDLGRTIFYEFKSVKQVPPENFLKQFEKDMMLASDPSQIKWVFDGKKVSQKGLTEAMKKAIDDWVIPDAVLEHWGYGLRDGLKFKNEKILPYLDSIFKTE